MAAYDGGPTPEDMSAFLAELKAAAEVPPVVAPAAAPAATDARVSRHLECATADVTHVMGLRGENVALYEQQSGASIKVAHGVQRRGQPARSRVLLDGPGAAVSHAARVIKEKLDEVKSPRHIQCPRAVIGKVIGRNGDRVKEIQEVTGANVQVDQRSDPCIVEVAGTPAQLTKASDLVVASMEGRYASALGTIADAHATHDRIIDPYREVDRNWYPARDEVGRVYWYHAHTGKTQWQNPYQPA